MAEATYDETSALLERLLGRAVVAAEVEDEAVLLLDFTGDSAGSGGFTLASYACGWRLETAQAVLAWSQDPKELLVDPVARLVGQVLKAVEVEPPSLSATFTFDDVVLKSFLIVTRGLAQWTLTLPDGSVLAAGAGPP